MQGDKKLIFSKITPLYLHRKDLKDLSFSILMLKLKYLEIKHLKKLILQFQQLVKKS
jgi:hypothetical protein